MNPDRLQFLNLRTFPARFNALETAIYLGFQEHDIPILVRCRLLQPLGSPSPNSVKYFCKLDLDACRSNRDWMHKATSALVRHWGMNNRRKKEENGLDWEP